MQAKHKSLKNEVAYYYAHAIEDGFTKSEAKWIARSIRSSPLVEWCLVKLPNKNFGVIWHAGVTQTMLEVLRDGDCNAFGIVFQDPKKTPCSEYIIANSDPDFREQERLHAEIEGAAA
jgi:hypothetical protein